MILNSDRLNLNNCLQEIETRCSIEVNQKSFQQKLKQFNIDLQPYQCVKRLWQGTDEALASLEFHEASESYQIYPLIIDICTQILMLICPTDNSLITNSIDSVYLPTKLETFQIVGEFTQQISIHVVLQKKVIEANSKRWGDVYIYNNSGVQIAEIKKLEIEAISLMGSAVHQVETFQDKLYEIDWKELPWESFSSSWLSDSTGSWLIFLDGIGVGENLVSLLQAAGKTCFTVSVGDRYQSSSGHFQINPAESQDMQQLISAVIRTQDLPLAGIIHLWSLDVKPTDQTTDISLGSDQERSTASALHLIQSLMSVREDYSHKSRIWLITQGAQALMTETVDVNVVQAPLWGLGRAIAKEAPEFWGGLIDIEPLTAPDIAAKELLHLITTKEQEDELVLRHSQPYVSRLQKSALLSCSKQLQFCADGTYLITGGLGGLGLQVAQWLAQRGAKNLVLVGRAIASDAAQEVINKLEKSGVQVTLAQLDVACPQQLAKAFATWETSLPPIRGIFHLAGVLDDALLMQQDWSRFINVRRSKVEGAWNLHTLTQHLPLDFFVLFSSAASVWTMPGQGNYAAANAFLDALAHYRRQQNLPALSINWGLWNDLGLTATTYGKQVESRLAQLGITGIASQQGLAILEFLLLQDCIQIGVVSVDWRKLFQEQKVFAQSPLLRELLNIYQPAIFEQEKNQGNIILSLKRAAIDERQQIFLDYLINQVTQILQWGTAPLPNPQRSLLELGLDSLMAFELKNRISNELEISISIEMFINGATLEEVAQIILEKLISEEIIFSELMQDNMEEIVL